MKARLGIIPCTKEKIWDYLPNIGSVLADCAYLGAEFVLSKRYMRNHADRIIIFSAKYGFLDVWDIIPSLYDVTFSREEDPYIGINQLKVQAQEKNLLDFNVVTFICNEHYQKRLFEVFNHPNVILKCPVPKLNSTEEICTRINQLILEDG